VRGGGGGGAHYCRLRRWWRSGSGQGGVRWHGEEAAAGRGGSVYPLPGEEGVHAWYTCNMSEEEVEIIHRGVEASNVLSNALPSTRRRYAPNTRPRATSRWRMMTSHKSILASVHFFPFERKIPRRTCAVAGASYLFLHRTCATTSAFIFIFFIYFLLFSLYFILLYVN